MVRKNSDITKVQGKAHIRLRPAMYIGSNNVLDLLLGLVEECSFVCKTDEIYFELSIIERNLFAFEIKSEHSLSPFLDLIGIEPNKINCEKAPILVALSNSLNFTIKKPKNVRFEFSIDPEVNMNTEIDYLVLMDKAAMIAILNPRTEIKIVDKTRKYLNQNYFHFQEGIDYLFKRITNEVFGKPEFIVKLESKAPFGEVKLILAYRTDWDPEAITSFYFNNNAIENHEIIRNCIYDALLKSSKSYAKSSKLKALKIKKNKLQNGLIVVCALKSYELNSIMEISEIIEQKPYQIELTKMIAKSIFKYMNANSKITADFLSRFDEMTFASAMMSDIKKKLRLE